MFGSKSGSHQWIIVTVDLRAAFRKLHIIGFDSNNIFHLDFIIVNF
jgi:hypothetical protein